MTVRGFCCAVKLLLWARMKREFKVEHGNTIDARNFKVVICALQAHFALSHAQETEPHFELPPRLRTTTHTTWR